MEPMVEQPIDVLRRAIAAACPTGEESVRVPQLAAMIGVSGESQMQLIRRRLLELAKRGELVKTGMGRWRPTGKVPLRRGESYRKAWRAVRTARGPFNAMEMAALTTIDHSTVCKYLRFLEGEGLVRRTGKQGNTVLHIITEAGRSRRATPYPIADIPDPFRTARAAAAQLCRIFLLEDAAKPSTRRRIREQLTLLNQEFMEEEEDHDQRED